MYIPDTWTGKGGVYREGKHSREGPLVVVTVEKKPRATHVARALRYHHYKSQTIRPSSTFHHFGSRFKPPNLREMDPDRAHDDSDLSPEPTVASALGLSGPIRFRLHGSTQKAHLLLKQSEEKRPLGGSSNTRAVACYSLFAQKRMGVKPRKEILRSPPPLLYSVSRKPPGMSIIPWFDLEMPRLPPNHYLDHSL